MDSVAPYAQSPKPYALSPAPYARPPDTLSSRSRIVCPMHRPCAGTFVAFLLLIFPVFASATAGSFRGVIVRGPTDQPGWIWVQGAHSTLRKVEVSRAEVVYDKTV